jgi:hypothetical protein
MLWQKAREPPYRQQSEETSPQHAFRSMKNAKHLNAHRDLPDRSVRRNNRAVAVDLCCDAAEHSQRIAGRPCRTSRVRAPEVERHTSRRSAQARVRPLTPGVRQMVQGNTYIDTQEKPSTPAARSSGVRTTPKSCQHCCGATIYGFTT